ncbi:cupin domain-containing protein [Roseovarius rhodophyticola]|uniref:Cupin domain-containing protein n=1 Tax=Roseovarius rhodophyticola TaxID=3080827 RepID=A0ABZ2TH65_9RHOB|nr:cupin domain-containing protein [Roseovarius sp. W115]MDV2929357.1 cupin domain-containing protein [Roseovarius sp. W115]
MSQTPFRIDPSPGSSMGPSTLTEAEAFTTDDTTELNHTHFATADESVLTGTWECAPCREEIDAYPVHEMMTVVEGHLRLTHPDGKIEEFGPGDTFFIAKGAPVIWEITKRLRKIYMIVE